MRALIIVDVQPDFLPGGPLAVPNGDEVIPAIRALIRGYSLVVATQDWHPPDHASFASHHGRAPFERIDLDGLDQVLWPDHCVAGTPGAACIDFPQVEAIFRKGTDPRIDSYSGFFDNGHRKATGLEGYLRGRGVTEVDVCGLATDYCVRATAFDAAKLGFSVRLLLDACRGLDPAGVALALADLRAVGVQIA